MSKLDDFLHSDLIVKNLDARDRTEAIQKLGSILFTKGYVKNTYIDAVLEREKKFPTGLAFEDGQVAIPHTDAEHCLKPGIAIGILNQPVEFFEMATLDKIVKTDLVFLLSIKVPEDQVEWLARLVNLFQQPGFFNRLKETSDAQKCYELLYGELRKEESSENTNL
jgi:PTS system galactitol-specific IIA component